MDAFNSGWAAVMAAGRATIGWCWKVTRLDEAVFGFTTSVIEIIVDGLPYEPDSGMIATDIQFQDTLAVDNFSIDGVITSDTFTLADIEAGKWDGASLEFFYVNLEDLTIGKRAKFTGTIGNISAGRMCFTAEQRGLTQPLTQQIVDLTSIQCRNKLGDSKCRVTLSLYAKTGTITTTDGVRFFTSTARTEPDGWFTGGNITMTSGDSVGISKEIKSSTHLGAFELVEPIGYGIADGDAYSMTPGCNHLLKMPTDVPLQVGGYTGDCSKKFTLENALGNYLNFGGEPETPGPDAIVQYGGRVA